MKISNKAKIAISVISMITKNDVVSSEPIGILAMATELHLSVSYIEQVVKHLREAGFVIGRRGPNGGYVLAKHPKDILIVDVIKTLDGDIDPTGEKEWDHLQTIIYKAISNITLKALIAKAND